MEKVMDSTQILENQARQVKAKMSIAIRCIDEEFGEGFAASNSTLLAAFMHSLEMEDISSGIYEVVETIEHECEDISSVLSSINNTLEEEK